MKGTWAKIIKGALIGGGTILSVLSGGALIPVGAALITAGAALPIGNQTTADAYSASSYDLLDSLGMSTAMAGGSDQYTSTQKLIIWAKQNILIVVGAGAFIAYIIFGRKKRR